MFKLLISLLLYPVVFLLALDGVAAGVCKWLLSRGFSGGPESAVHSAKATVYFMIAGGLTLSMVCCSFGIVLTVLSFVFKSWERAFVSIGVALVSVVLWRFFLALPYVL